MGRTGGSMRGPAALELAHREGGQHLIFRYPGHDAPRPHNARPSWSRTYFTSTARGTRATVGSTAGMRSEDAPGAKSNR